eukprot:tig00020780_g13803.t1
MPVDDAGVPAERTVVRRLAADYEDEIVSFAVHTLGIDPELEPHLLSIAEEAYDAPLPAPWRQIDDGQGRLYFYNDETDVSQWEHPLDKHYRAYLSVRRRMGAGRSPKGGSSRRQEGPGAGRAGRGWEGSARETPVPAGDEGWEAGDCVPWGEGVVAEAAESEASGGATSRSSTLSTAPSSDRSLRAQRAHAALMARHAALRPPPAPPPPRAGPGARSSPDALAHRLSRLPPFAA